MQQTRDEIKIPQNADAFDSLLELEHFLAAGYSGRLIPLYAGDKRPKGEDWHVRTFSDETLRQHVCNGGNIGLRLTCREPRLVVIEAEHSAIGAEIFDLIRNRFPDAPVRSRKGSTSRCVLLRAGGPVPGWTIKRPDSVEGDKADLTQCQVSGQLHVVGTRADKDNARVEWSKTVPIDQLPAVTGEDVSRLLADLREMIAGLGIDPGQSTISHDEAKRESNDFSRTMALREVDAETTKLVRSALTALKPERADGYGDWIKIGQALYSLAQAGFDQEANELWHEFSARSPKYDAETAQDKWETFKPGQITYKTIFFLAEQDGWSHPKKKAATDHASLGDGGARKMRLEWFNDACDLALSDQNRPLISDMLDEGAMSVVYGESNAGKTFVMLDMVFSVSTGLPWNGKPTERGLVVYVAAEGGKRITQRLAALRKRHAASTGEDAPAPLFALVRYPIDLRSSDANLKELLALVKDAERACGEKCVWIVVDTLSRALAGGDENSSVDMGRVVVAADRIRAETGAHFSYVHHTGKDAARGARGHSLLRAATDTEVEVSPGALKITKQRDMEGGQEFGFTLDSVLIGADANGGFVNSATVEWTGAPAAKTSARREGHIPAGQRLLIEVVKQTIEEAGELVALSSGSIVRAASDEEVREKYYSRVAESPPQGDTPQKLAERQRKAFNSAIKANIDAKRIAATNKGGRRLIWIANEA